MKPVTPVELRRLKPETEDVAPAACLRCGAACENCLILEDLVDAVLDLAQEKK